MMAVINIDKQYREARCHLFIVPSRILIPIGDHCYYISWDNNAGVMKPFAKLKWRPTI